MAKIYKVAKVAITIAIIIIVNIVPVLYPRYAYPQSLEDELEDIEQQRKETQQKIEEIKKQEQQYIKQVESVENELLSALSELEDLNNRLAEVKSEIDKTTIELVLKEQELKRIEEELEEKVNILNLRVASIYKNGNVNILEMLLKSKSFMDFVSQVKLMNLIAQQDAEIIQSIKDKRNATLSVKKTMIDLREKQNEQKERVEKLVAQAEEKKAEIEGIYVEKKNLLSQTIANKNALIRMEKELAAREAEIKRILESYRYGSAPSGKLAWPVAGRIISGFGYRIHPIFGTRRFHAGVDFAAPYGTPVKAADGGQVIQTAYVGGYGYAIMIYHGGGYATWYAHLSGFNVSTGQFVQRGQVIGFVGSTGWSTGPHLHFEVRINGEPQNPLGYLQ
ncbi:MAG: peptidoglycan DD-metalloendopeptidase family protein [Actinobacteria bacterium]|nr:peptidoglycan DD-metalloendopeptidase family protein [Actinomycetota bacterium]